jgi:NTP pyrophosphatase (non-canonical NTP hydrolase)
LSEEHLTAAVATLTDRALQVRALFEKFETDTYGREWSVQDLTAGLVVDVGDLTRLVQAVTGVRQVDDVQAKLAHELSDCLWSVLVLAKKLGVDLGGAFSQTMSELERQLGAPPIP